MNKTKKIILPLALAVILFFSACGLTACGEAEIPATVPGQNTYIENARGTPATNDAEYVAYAVAGKLRQASTYIAAVTGKTVAQKGFINYEQVIDNTLIKHGDEFYSQSVSTSFFVNMNHEAFVKNGKVAYRNNGAEIKLADEAAYADVYGVIPGDGLDGHILNADTILDAKYVGEENGLYKFEYVVHKDDGSAAMRKQMKEFGGLNGLPEFVNNSRLTLTVREDWTPVALVTEERYDISVAVLGSMSCTQTLTCAFADFDAETAIPDTEAFNAAMNSTPSVVTPGGNAGNPALEGLIGALLESDLAGGVALRGNINACGLSLPLSVGACVDPGKLAGGNVTEALKLSAAVSLAGLDVNVWVLDNRLYLDAAGHKYVAALPQTNFATDAIGGAVEIVATADGYRLKLTAAARALLGNVLADAELIANKADADFYVDFYAPTDRIGAVTATLVVGTDKITADLTLAEKKFAEPQNISEFQSEISQSATVTIRMPAALNLDITADIALSYDLSDPNPATALKADLRIDTMRLSQEGGYELKNMLMMAAIFAPAMDMELPPIVGLLGEADVINITCPGDGNLFLVLQKNAAAENEAHKLMTFYIQKLPLDAMTGLSLASETAETKKSDAALGLPVLSLIDDFLFTKNESGLSVSLTGNAHAYADKLFTKLNDAIIGLMGDKGGAMAGMLGLGNKLKSVDFAVTKDENGYMDRVALNIGIYIIDKNSPDKPLAELETKDLLQLTIDFNGKLSEPIANPLIAPALANYALALPTVAKIDALKAVEPTADNAAALILEIDAVENEYNALPDAVKIMVTNAKVMVNFDIVSVFDRLRDAAAALLTPAA